MDKEQTLFRLRAIVNQIACMSQEEFSGNVFDDTLEMFFENYLFGEKAQVRTHLTMKKVFIDTGLKKKDLLNDRKTDKPRRRSQAITGNSETNCVYVREGF